jgi:ABC-type nickel/cobalt efflux system permease component RcnA
LREIDLVCLKVLTITILVLLLSVMAEGRCLTIALHQIAYGLVLTGGFSLGLASVLTTLGLAAVSGRQWLESFPSGSEQRAKIKSQPPAALVQYLVIQLSLSYSALNLP